MNWRLNKIQFPVYNLGDGKRIGIWVQGCNLGCRGCINKEIWPPDGGASISIDVLVRWIMYKIHDFDGITLTGGEPFQQYEQMIVFLEAIKRHSDLNIQCYTGYTLRELDVLYPDRAFYAFLDVIVDGRFMFDRATSEGWRGSDNQNRYVMDAQVPIKKNEYSKNNILSLNMENDSCIYFSGIPGASDWIDIKSSIGHLISQSSKY